MGNMMKLLALTVVLSLYQFAAAVMVPLTILEGAQDKGAVCLDGTLAAYHFQRGYGSGRNSWLFDLEGGGWCHNVKNCVERCSTKLGSSKLMKELLFAGILSKKAKENPDFFNWNRVNLCHCDGASFSGDGQNENPKLYFRGQLIWTTAVEYFMTKEGMQNATQALLSGGSAGGLAAIIHCDEFSDLFPQSTKVKCFSDVFQVSTFQCCLAGMFLDVMDISGKRTQRKEYEGVVSLQGVAKNLPASCTSKLDPTLCFFPHNLIDNVRTPLFLLNAAYDIYQINNGLVPASADPHGDWHKCKRHQHNCNSSQIQVFQGFRDEMLNALKTFSGFQKNGVFINSCFDHCQAYGKKRWFGKHSPEIKNTRIAEAVGNWYFDRADDHVKLIDCSYPCDHNCVNIVY